MTTITCPTFSLWGPVQYAGELAPGIFTVSIAGHGGIWLSPERQAQMPESCRSTPYSRGGWYEEDCDAIMPLFKFYDDVKGAIGPYTREALADILKGNVRYYTAQRLADLGVGV
jgi:energy-converting hydrogenase Eha subunit F